MLGCCPLVSSGGIGTDARRYNAGAVLPQGVSDVQSIRATQTADPRAKQTHPSRPARGSAKVNTRPGDGGSPGSMTAGRFRWGEVVESFLGQPPLAGLPAVADRSGPQRGGAGDLRCPPEPAPAKAGGLNAIAAVFTGASWQRCRTHFMANLLTRVPKRAQPGVATMVRTIYQQLSPAEVHGQLDRVVEQLREAFPQVAELLADAAPDILAFTAFPVAHWQKLWSNNPQERLNREIRRRRACPRKGT